MNTDYARFFSRNGSTFAEVLLQIKDVRAPWLYTHSDYTADQGGGGASWQARYMGQSDGYRAIYRGVNEAAAETNVISSTRFSIERLREIKSSLDGDSKLVFQQSCDAWISMLGGVLGVLEGLKTYMGYTRGFTKDEMEGSMESAMTSTATRGRSKDLADFDPSDLDALAAAVTEARRQKDEFELVMQWMPEFQCVLKANLSRQLEWLSSQSRGLGGKSQVVLSGQETEANFAQYVADGLVVFDQTQSLFLSTLRTHRLIA